MSAQKKEGPKSVSGVSADFLAMLGMLIAEYNWRGDFGEIANFFEYLCSEADYNRVDLQKYYTEDYKLVDTREAVVEDILRKLTPAPGYGEKNV